MSNIFPKTALIAKLSELRLRIGNTDRRHAAHILNDSEYALELQKISNEIDEVERLIEKNNAIAVQ